MRAFSAFSSRIMPKHTAARPLQPRLLAFGLAVGKWARRLPRDVAMRNVITQIVRSAMSAAANHAEAQGAESRRDFLHKLQICRKELHETAMWLRAAEGLGTTTPQSATLRQECDELLAIVTASVNTVKKNLIPR
jgi:four helix bundle protein